MYIKKLIVKNFKKISSDSFDLNEHVNILVGDNDSGKTTILEALELGTSASYRGKPITTSLNAHLFNIDAVAKYLKEDRSKESLPEILVEIYLSDCPEYRGKNNSLDQEEDGIFLRICFDDDLTGTYENFLKNADSIDSVPTEFYKVEWFSFAWEPIKFLNRKVKGLFIDPTKLHPTYGKTQYLSNIINSSLTKEQQALLNLNYRQLKQSFEQQEQVKNLNDGLDTANQVTEQNLSIIADTNSGTVEAGLQLAVDEVSFSHIGKGEQSKIQVKLALLNKGGNANFVTVEEPENHLSHTNLSELIEFIANNSSNQVFITTHSSYVLNKLSLGNLCLIADRYLRLNNIDSKTAKTLQRLPGYDTLRIVLSRKVILVEGPSDELLLKKIYIQTYGKLPEMDGIDIIVVRGIGFNHYLQIAKHTGTQVNVVKDNDGSYQENIIDYAAAYPAENISFFSEADDELKSLEPSLIKANSDSNDSLLTFAEIALATQTFNKLKKLDDLDKKIEFFIAVYIGPKGDKNYGTKKVDSAIRIFDSEEEIQYPDYLVEALKFD
ncbi:MULTISPECIES: ATP-dependent nuclease [Vibrio]|uniref:ATP-dependent endonuclease n=2 Tax=Vibrio TaxID=662 RepID=A0A855IUR8_9VIBR|nr:MULTISPECIES: AAA family ATPase [Vibrio]OEE01393.1 ATP-dependent endonuclease [Vibrio cyclitrophicus ZF270]PMM61624.1 ATP-dependent endonuclease [Vibrio lentus]UPR25578.1 AAA family ATPase [Vibrio cyclitrophicus]